MELEVPDFDFFNWHSSQWELELADILGLILFFFPFSFFK